MSDFYWEICALGIYGIHILMVLNSYNDFYSIIVCTTNAYSIFILNQKEN